ncbi:MAG: branched-chain amino acid ABC transporter permease [Anaerolineae bacterium]|nr:branched-chain amino acid ABC transporter permease [Anaerolineae bacterium]MDW8068680.1 branched-chain amino acid ABC transporter permease [Anaerolineae bacterium]
MKERRSVVDNALRPVRALYVAAVRPIQEAYNALPASVRRWTMPAVLLLGFLLSLAAPSLINLYWQQVLIYVGINIILAASLNLINGYMGEFSVGHAGFMAVGAYVASIMTVWVFPRMGLKEAVPYLFPLALTIGGLAAGLTGLVVAIPSFRTRGDYLAIVTLAWNMIVKSVLENLDVVGGPRGFMGMQKLTNLPWVFVWVVVTIYLLRNLIYSNLGRGILSIREDEIASSLVSVDTRRVKIVAFVISSFFAGVAGGLFAHIIQFIDPRTFSILKSTDVLVMVYLGGIGSLGGSILGASIYTILMELLRPLQVWRWVVGPLLLVLLMIFRPRGIMGLREWGFLIPKEERPAFVDALREQVRQKREPAAVPAGASE